ncbi:MAG: hypothetical protein M1819_002198 [Sarea resinae]|nr:MAG: hypothetical protein M1819_002198 [Sarea resinae]
MQCSSEFTWLIDSTAMPQGGLTHGFVVEFESEEDRAYYVHKDPAHLGFVKSLDGIVVGARVLDFVPGVY